MLCSQLFQVINTSAWCRFLSVKRKKGDGSCDISFLNSAQGAFNTDTAMSLTDQGKSNTFRQCIYSLIKENLFVIYINVVNEGRARQ